MTLMIEKMLKKVNNQNKLNDAGKIIILKAMREQFIFIIIS